MRQTSLVRWTLSLSLILFLSCQKQIPNSPASDPAGSDPTKKAVTGLPIGGGDGSGVDQTTGYRILQKHYLKDANGNYLVDNNGNLIWDGTYDAGWYTASLNVTICRYKLEYTYGDPVFGEITTPPGYGNDVTSGCVSSFTLTTITAILTPYYTPTTLSAYELTLTNFFNGSTDTYPLAPNSLNGGAILTRYGKLITVSPGVYAIAEMNWAPAAPSCNAQCQLCRTNPNDPSCP